MQQKGVYDRACMWLIGELLWERNVVLTAKGYGNVHAMLHYKKRELSLENVSVFALI